MAKLLRGGTVLVHDKDHHVEALKADLLIEGSTISKIEATIQPPTGVEVIDCTDKIISPGFIDTHHHVWQTLLKGRHADQLLVDYFAPGNFTSSLHEPEDVYWGQLGGVLEMLDVGTTTVVDHAHVNYSPQHTKAALAATVASGIRSIFGYSATPRIESWDPFVVAEDLLAPWVLDTLQELATGPPIGKGRVEMGFSFDGIYLPKDIVVPLIEKVKSWGVKTITAHYVHAAALHIQSVIEGFHNYGLLDSSIIISHATNLSERDAKLMEEARAFISTTPSTEHQMGMGESCAFHTAFPALQAQGSIGVDCHSNNSASIVSELRLLLQASRAHYHQRFVDVGVCPKQVYKTVEEAFNLGTLGGARAIGREHDLGTLKVGYMADVLVWDALSPAMVCAAEQDPVAALVLHSSPGDLEMVIVDGVVRKRDGRLVAVETLEGEGLWKGNMEGQKGKRGRLEWREISRELVRRREGIQRKIEKIDMAKAKKGVMAAWFIDETKFVDSV